MNKVYQQFSFFRTAVPTGHDLTTVNPLEPWLDGYDKYIRNTRGLSENTRRIYNSDVKTFGEYLNEESRDFKSLDRKMLIHYQAWLIEQAGYKRISVSRKTTALRSFYNYLRWSGELDFQNNPVSKGFRVGRKALPKPLNLTEVNRLLYAPEEDSPLHIRDRAILEILYSCGLRLSEIQQVTLEDINLPSKEILIRHGKGNDKQRFVLFGEPASQALKNYLESARPEIIAEARLRKTVSETTALFINHSGKPLSGRSIQKIVTKYSERAGLTKGTHTHTLRHTFATHMLEGEADLRIIQELMGHASPVTTGVYTSLTKQEARKAYFAHHPRANIQE